MSQSKTIIIRDVSFKVKLNIGEVKTILNNISLTLKTGETTGILGINGAGKTTLLRLLGNLEKPTNGKIIKSPKNTRVAIVLQRPEDHFIHETVKKQISSYSKKRLPYEIFCKIIDQVGISHDLIFSPPYSLSTGEQRLVAIASALAKNADFYIFDEPMAGLDAKSRNLVKNTLHNLGEINNVGIMLITHHPDDLLGFTDRILILGDQKILYDGPMNDVPVNMLNVCLSKSDPSLYYLLRKIDEQHGSLATNTYYESSVNEIAKEVKKVLES